MAATLSSFSPSADAGKHSQKFKELLEIICSGGGEHPKLFSRQALVGGGDQPDGPTKPMLFASAAAYEILRRGVTSRALIAIGDYIGIGRGALADLLGLNRVTAYRKIASGQLLPMHAAESVLRLLELQWLAEDIFETPDAATAWMLRGHPLLDGDAPLARVKSAYGSEKVKEILVALKYGGVM